MVSPTDLNNSTIAIGEAMVFAASSSGARGRLESNGEMRPGERICLGYKILSPSLLLSNDELWSDPFGAWLDSRRSNVCRGSPAPGSQAKQRLLWDKRFKIAVGVAEALSYLHNGCSLPVVHRDVKSSNILLKNLNDGFEPQLSDFGLDIWAPKNSLFQTHSDVVGTFGYLAPEYFMYGKVSNKIDVYAYGVVLLELLIGRKPICDVNMREFFLASLTSFHL